MEGQQLRRELVRICRLAFWRGLTAGAGGNVIARVGAAVSFLELGAQPPSRSGGAVINAGRQWLGLAWWLYIFPGMATVVAVLGISLLGDALRDVLDPRLKV